MGLCLIATDTILVASSLFDSALPILGAVLGLGFVIFVHELGHFGVAKMCGVQCDKFFVGFDIGGYKISRKWGETEYGIGILPLGGYVKMLGQDDDPSQLSEQLVKSQEGLTKENAKEIFGPDGKTYLVDKRSYLAKNVPQRMAIISAGVIMNVIFAMIFAMIAYGIGAPYQPIVIGGIAPGSAVWEQNWAPGEEIVELNGKKNLAFSDLLGTVITSDKDEDLVFKFKKSDGTFEQRLLTPHRRSNGIATIGLANEFALTLTQHPTIQNPYRLGVVPKEEQAAFKKEDQVIAVNGTPITAHHQLVAMLSAHPEEDFDITVLRAQKNTETETSNAQPEKKEITLKLAPVSFRRFGLVMKIGKITAIQKDSPAAIAGLLPGDFIEQINGQPIGMSDSEERIVWDPMTLADEMRKRALNKEEVTFIVRRENTLQDGSSSQIKLTVKPTIPNQPMFFASPHVPLGIPALGITYRVLNRVDAIYPNSPVTTAGSKILKDDEITAVTILRPKSFTKEMMPKDEITIKLGDEAPNWPFFIALTQNYPIGTTFKFSIKRADKKIEVSLESHKNGQGVFIANRGLVFKNLTRIRQAKDFSEQVSLGWDRTKHSLTSVYRFLGGLSKGNLPATALGGPLSIYHTAVAQSSQGFPRLLLFLTMLSANLAVVNFLPIPVLDGGHMVFLIYEGITKRPPNPNLVMALTLAGLVLLLSLMLFVTGLDLHLIDRGLSL